MIVVIADDLTGAAELGGIGLRYNLKTEITTQIESLPKAELLIIDLDTRSKTQQDAEITIERVCRKLLDIKPSFIFKKIDSVLRGHVLPEIKVQMKVFGQQRALIVSANPGLERTIVNGQYLYKSKLIHLSSFAHDPEFPVTSSFIHEMLRAKGDEVHVLKTREPLPETGFIVGEVQTAADLSSWAKRLNPGIITAGASGFFEAILQELHYKKSNETKEPIAFRLPSLYVCGTTFQKSRDAIKREKERGGPVSYFPADLIREQAPLDEHYIKWVDEINLLLQYYQKAVVAIDPDTAEGASANELRERMAIAIASIIKQKNITELFLEGGSSAAAILRRSGICNFHPVEQLGPGVIRMQEKSNRGLFFTLKPGSYDWPPDIPIF